MVGDPYPDAFVSVVVPVVDGDGRHAVLKVQCPHRESEHEAAALARWAGTARRGSSRTIPTATRCCWNGAEPGISLAAVDPDVALGVLIGLLPRLWVPAGAPFTSAVAEAAHWTAELPATWERAGRPFERALVDRAIGLLHELAPTPRARPVLLHQDLHAGNVLAATREPWLVIDPKPLAGSASSASHRSSAARSSATPRLQCATGSTGSPPSSASTASGLAPGRSRRPWRGRSATTR